MSEEEQEHHHLEDHHEDYYDILANQKLTMRDITDHMTGPVISGVIHIILIAFLSSIIVFEPAAEQDEIEVEMTDMEIKPMEEPPEPPEPPEEIEADEVEVEIERPDVDPGPPAEAPVADIAMNDSALQVDVSDIMGGGGLLMEANSSALTLNVGETFKMRSVTGRAKALSKYNVSPAADTAVTKALDYFQKTQKSDGSWGGGQAPAMTALAILCYLAHGDTPDSEKYGETVMKGIRKLVAFSKRKAKSFDNRLIAQGGNGYGHAMVTYALAEAYALTKIPMVKEAMNDMVIQVMEGMNKYGSYDYKFVQKVPKGGHGKVGSVRSDLSLAGWCYQSMKAAFAAGCDVKGLEKSIERAIKALKVTHKSKGGGFSYSGGKNGGGGASNTMTAVGVLCLQLLGEGRSPEAKAGLKWFETKKHTYPTPPHGKGPHPKETLKKESLSYLDCNWEKAPRCSLYQWYYMTQALFQASTTKSGSPKAWRKWNASFTKTLLENQNPDGSWDDPAVKNPRIHVHGPKKGVYPTALCTLMLEVYYRYLPTFKLHGGGHDKKSHKVKDDAEDLGITF